MDRAMWPITCWMIFGNSHLQSKNAKGKSNFTPPKTGHVYVDKFLGLMIAMPTRNEMVSLSVCVYESEYKVEQKGVILESKVIRVQNEGDWRGSTTFPKCIINFVFSKLNFMKWIGIHIFFLYENHISLWIWIRLYGVLPLLFAFVFASQNVPY